LVLEVSKSGFQKAGEEISQYSQESYEIVTNNGMPHKEALEAIKENLLGTILAYNEAKDYIQEVCHQPLPTDKATDLAHQVMIVPEFGQIAMGVAAVGTAIALYLSRNKLFGDKSGGLSYKM
jgi:hypothetical protein